MTRVLLVGLMGAGKSTVGEEISAATGWQYLDNDTLLERCTGRTAAQLLAEEGEQRLREAESDVVTLLLGMPGPFVCGIAAGTVLDPVDRERIREAGHVVYLKVPVRDLVRRVLRQPERAWLKDDPEKVLRAMAIEREPLYEAMAHQVLDMERLSPAEAAREVIEALPSG